MKPKVCPCDRCSNLVRGKSVCRIWNNNFRPRKMLNCTDFAPGPKQAESYFEPAPVGKA